MIKRTVLIVIVLYANLCFSQDEQVYDACVFPGKPAIPEGTVTEEQLITTISTVKNYQSDLQTFRSCIDQLKVAIDEKNMTAEMIEKNKKANAQLNAVYNLSVDIEQEIVDQLNTQIRKVNANK